MVPATIFHKLRHLVLSILSSLFFLFLLLHSLFDRLFVFETSWTGDGEMVFCAADEVFGFMGVEGTFFFCHHVTLNATVNSEQIATTNTRWLNSRNGKTRGRPKKGIIAAIPQLNHHGLRPQKGTPTSRQTDQE